MNETSPGILILGGGVTGMSAALALKNQNVAVHLVETQNRLGGNAAGWACMATTTCQNCGACLAQEIIDQIQQTDIITVHLNTELSRLNQTPQGLEAELSSGTTLSVTRVLMATGFSPFDPAAISSYHTQNLDNVITTADLNRLLREDRLGSLVGNAPQIAFLQCVGSRDRSQNRDYCSQVCCKISMRHAQKIHHLMPDANISLFYMDLQIIGKETRTLAENLAGNIHLIQGVPAEILEDIETGRLTMVTEDPTTNTRQSNAFDLIVLSVGLVPNQKTAGLTDILGLTPNPWGFFNTPDAALGKHIHIAGCANGPKDIPSAIQEGRIAAAQITRQLNLAAPSIPNRNKAIAIIGSGPEAATIASAAADKGYAPTLFGKAENLPSTIMALEDANILSINGTLDNFSIFYQKDETKQTLTCGAIIAAPQPHKDHRAQSIPGAVSLTEFTTLAPEKRPDNSLILLDYFGPESKVGARQALLTAIETCKTEKTVDILMNKMLVHGPGGQQIYDKARNMGIRFLRFDTPSDLIIETGNNGVEISLKEATLPGMDLTLTPGTLVVPDTPSPTAGFSKLAQQLRLDLDTEGFLQPGNVRYRLVQSQRKGIYFAGTGHDDIDHDDLRLEINAILADLENGPALKGRLTIDDRLCARCLTCYRICPHGAITLDEKQKPRIMADACFECHACLSNCPAYAIESSGQANADLAAPAQKGRTLVFACERSSALAAADALPPEADLAVIPCTCRVSPDIILRALIKGVDRVVICGCHEGNCRSGDGSAIARHSVATVSAFPGIPHGKVTFRPVAANEPCALTNAITKA